jgi:hypothetical protein
VQTLAGAFSQRAAAAVERDWPWIQRVANALVRARTLTGGEVLRLRDAPDEETSRQSDDEPSAAARDNAHAFARAIVDASTPGGAGADLADVLAEATRQYFIARKEQRSMAGAEVQEL